MLQRLKEIYEKKVPSFLKNKWGAIGAILMLAAVAWLLTKSFYLVKFAIWAAIVYALCAAFVYIKNTYDKFNRKK
jgi:hypothetical protein